MCHLQEVFFSCGHNRLILLKPCNPAKRKGLVPGSKIPDICISGLLISSCRRDEGQCGLGSGYGYTCTQYAALQPLWKRHDEMVTELDSFVSRASKVEHAFSIWAPEMDFGNVGFGYVGARERRKKGAVEFAKNSHKRTLANMPKRLEEFCKAIDAFYVELESALQLQIAAALADLDGDEYLARIESESQAQAQSRSRTPNPPPTAILHIDVHRRAPDLRGFKSTDLSTRTKTFKLIERAWYIIRNDAHRRLMMLEEMAVGLGLDAVGWRPPAEEKDNVNLRVLMGKRLVQPLVG